jgi:hypothetical protein
VLEKMMKDNYTRDAVHILKLKITKIDRLAKRCAFMPFFNKIAKKANLERRKSFLVDSQMAFKCFMRTRDGEVLEKFHYSSNGSRKEFFKVTDNKYLRWSRDKKNIAVPNKCHTLDLVQIKGLTFGKVTSTFQKKKNSKLFPWLCISIIMDKRSFDICCTEDNVNAWYIGLAYAVKKHNPNAVVLTIGNFFWRKMRFLLTYLVLDSMTEDQRKKYSKRGLSFAKVVLLSKRIKFRA